MAKNKIENADSIIALRPKLLAETLMALVEVGRTTCLEGSPGLGKTSIYKQVAEKLTAKHGKPYGLILKHLPTMQPEDFGLPLPNVDKTKITFIVPDWFPTQQAIDDKIYPEHGILLFDDRNQADFPHQKILANIVQERELHGQNLAAHWTVASTGNQAAHRSGVNKVLTHLRNRETILELQPDLDEWCDWAYKHKVRPEVIAALRFLPDMLSDFDPAQDANPTPRAWAEGVSPILGKVPRAAEAACISGAVGKGAGVKFLGFLETYRDLPDPEEIIKNPDKAPVPENPATLYAVCGALAYRATKKNFGNIIKYCNRLDPEFSVITIMDSLRKDNDLGSTPEFGVWSVKYQDIVVRQ